MFELDSYGGYRIVLYIRLCARACGSKRARQRE